MQAWLYYLLAMLLIVVNVVSMATNLFLLPGNWLIVVMSAGFAWLVQGPAGQGVTWGTVLAVIVVASLGELAEFLAGAAGAARLGGSRRGIFLSMLGAMLGSMLGIGVGLPVPLVGPIVAAVLGGAFGSFAGAYLGEQWKGRSHADGLAIGGGAMVGRLGGTVAKLAASVIMVVLIAWDCLF